MMNADMPSRVRAYFQLKAAERLEKVGSNYVFALDKRDYNLWMMEVFPVFLILFDATRRRGYWLFVQHYFSEHALQPKQGSKKHSCPRSDATDRWPTSSQMMRISRMRPGRSSNGGEADE